MTTVARIEKRTSPRRRRARGGVRVLIVDADAELRSALGVTLAAAGFAVEMAGTGQAALRQSLITDYGLIIFDLILPDADGRALLTKLLAARPHQVIIVVSRVTDPAVKVSCLEAGARDYLTKPFSPEELLARVRLRLEPFAPGWDGHVLSPPASAWQAGSATGRTGAGSCGSGGLHLDVSRLTADVGDGPVRLTRTEFSLLMTLAEHAGRPLSTRRLLREVWGYGFEVRSNAVGVCVRRLRAKLGASIIETVHGEGYRLAGEANHAQQLVRARGA